MSDKTLRIFYGHLAGPPVFTHQAVSPRGIDPVTVRKPEPTSPLIEAGNFLDRADPSISSNDSCSSPSDLTRKLDMLVSTFLCPAIR